jgi:hypothetical protein
VSDSLSSSHSLLPALCRKDAGHPFDRRPPIRWTDEQRKKKKKRKANESRLSDGVVMEKRVRRKKDPRFIAAASVRTGLGEE